MNIDQLYENLILSSIRQKINSFFDSVLSKQLYHITRFDSLREMLKNDKIYASITATDFDVKNRETSYYISTTSRRDSQYSQWISLSENPVFLNFSKNIKNMKSINVDYFLDKYGDDLNGFVDFYKKYNTLNEYEHRILLETPFLKLSDYVESIDIFINKQNVEDIMQRLPKTSIKIYVYDNYADFMKRKNGVIVNSSGSNRYKWHDSIEEEKIVNSVLSSLQKKKKIQYNKFDVKFALNSARITPKTKNTVAKIISILKTEYQNDLDLAYEKLNK